jgi:lipopolysaccharide/colanic/teichoic acid biosynthesis glycosyltransferase
MSSGVPGCTGPNSHGRGRAGEVNHAPGRKDSGTTESGPHDKDAFDVQSLAEHYARLSREVPPHARVDPILRVLDLVIAASALILLSPVLLLVAGAMLASSGRPLLYRGLRVGRHGRLFTMLKIRTLARGAEDRLVGHSGAELTRLTSAETTPAGRWLRASQFDEMPQLWNVLVGDMSIVGPRPIRPAFFAVLARDIPQYWQRLVVRPGLTGFAQLRMTRDETWEQKLAHDLEYIADRSVGLYLRVTASTSWRLLRQSAAAVSSMLGSVRPRSRRQRP